MKRLPLLASIALLAATAMTTTPALAGARDARPDDRAARHDGRDHRPHHQHGHAAHAQRGDGFDHGLQAVAIHPGPGEPGHGWRYYADPATVRAVVISPQGAYYLSHGEGLDLVAGTPPAR